MLFPMRLNDRSGLPVQCGLQRRCIADNGSTTGTVGKPDSRFHFRLHAAGSKVCGGDETIGIVTTDWTDRFLIHTSIISTGTRDAREDQQQFRIKLIGQ